MISGHDPNPIVFKHKKIKTRCPEHSLTSRPLHPITSHFWFVEQILDAVIKLVPIGFLSILKMQYIKGKVFSFSVTLKPDCLICYLFSAAGIQLHLKEVFFDFHIFEWSKSDQIRTAEANIFNVNFGLEIKC